MSLFDRRKILIAGAGLALVGCGFEPVYRAGSTAAELQNQIAIDLVRGRNGFEMRERLEDRLGFAMAEAPYVLTFKLTFTEKGLAVTADEGTTRLNLTGIAAFTIRRVTDNAIVYKDKVRNFTAYSTTSSTYPSRVAKREANVRLAQALAEQIAERIAITAKDWAT